MSLEGKPLRLGKREFIVPDPSIDVAEKVFAWLQNLGAGGDAAAQWRAIIEIVLAALEPNYPDLTAAELKKCIPARWDRIIKPFCEALDIGQQADAGEAKSP
jgi:hypothetical protein